MNMENNTEAQYCLKGQRDILDTHRVATMLEKNGIDVYAGDKLIHRHAFAEICRMYEQQKLSEAIAQQEHKKKIKQLKIAIVAIIAVCSVLCVSFHAQNKELLAHQVSIENDLEDAKEELSDIKRDYNKKTSELINLIKDYNKVSDENDFWSNNAVIVTTTGEKYHTYDCYHIDGRRYWIYNIELAKVKGYTACLDCIEW